MLRAAASAARRGVRLNQQASAESHKFDPLDTTRRRLLYRSKQRGAQHPPNYVNHQSGLPTMACASRRLARDGHHARKLGARAPRPSYRPPRDTRHPRRGYQAAHCAQAASNLSRLEAKELDEFAEVLDMENPDLYNWLTGQKPVPGDVRNPLLRKLCADLRRDMVRPAPPSRHTARPVGTPATVVRLALISQRRRC